MPKVSVILPAWNSHRTIANCLESLERQSFRDFEIILVDSSPVDETAGIVVRFPFVRIERSAERLWPHAARNVGATLAQGELLVFSDPDCVMSPEWLTRLVAGAEQGHSLAGGSVGSVQSDWFSAGVHLCKYAWWLPGGEAGPRPELPSANVSYRGDLFKRIGPFPEAWSGDTLLSQRAASAGVEPWFDPEARVLHDHHATWKDFLVERWERGYDAGSVRPRVEGWSRARAMSYAFAAPLIAAVMLARAARYAVESGNSAWFARCLPVVALGYAARACGE